MGTGVAAFTIVTVSVLASVSGVATVASVVFTLQLVVYIVTEAVTHMGVDAFGPLVRGFPTEAIFTVLRLHLEGGRRAAITTIPVARFSVIVVIAEIVPLELKVPARVFDVLTSRVQAFAFLTVNELLRVGYVHMTTITTVPAAFPVVVLVITVCVLSVSRAFALLYTYIAAAETTIALAFEE